MDEQHQVSVKHGVSGDPAPSLSHPPRLFVPRRAAISRDPFYEMLAARKKKVSSMKRH